VVQKPPSKLATLHRVQP